MKRFLYSFLPTLYYILGLVVGRYGREWGWEGAAWISLVILAVLAVLFVWSRP